MEQEVGAAFEAFCQMSKGAVDWVQSSVTNLAFNRTEATVEQYQACVNDGVCTNAHIATSTTNSDCNYGASGRNRYPMNCVNALGAENYCTWLGGRLPTEAEWSDEASNNGTQTYPWGDLPVASCDYCVMDEVNGSGKGCGTLGSLPVASRLNGNNVSGLSDMSGNVSEWTSTIDPVSGNPVVRGGSWDDSDQQVTSRSAAADANEKYTTIGARCVLDPASIGCHSLSFDGVDDRVERPRYRFRPRLLL